MSPMTTREETPSRRYQRHRVAAPDRKRHAAFGSDAPSFPDRARLARRGTPPRIPAPPGMAQTRQEALSSQNDALLDSCTSHRLGPTEFWYRIEDGEATIVFCESEEKRLVVPEALGGAPVTAIADNAFSDLAGIESVAMPATLRTIGAQAFARCLNLRSVDAGQSQKAVGVAQHVGGPEGADTNWPGRIAFAISGASSTMR